MKVLLFGISSVGKTTVGRLLAERLSYTFYDLDEEVVKYSSMSIDKTTKTKSYYCTELHLARST